MSASSPSNVTPNDRAPGSGGSLVHALRDVGLSGARESMPGSTSLSPTSEVGEFAAKMLEAAQATRCVGTSCRMQGASGFHRDLEGAVAELRPDFVWVNTGCLARCGHGPNLRVGRQIYSDTARRIETDTRTWVK